MNFNREYHELVKRIKDGAKKHGIRLSDGDFAKRLSYTRSHFNVLKGNKNGPAPESVKVTESHVRELKNEFSNELKGLFMPSPPGDLLNKERAQIKALWHHVAKLEAAVFKISLEKSLNGLEDDTIIAISDLDNG